MTTDWLLALIPMILLLIISIIVRSQCESWIHPSAYFLLVVMLYFLPPLVFAYNTYIWPGAMWWILASALAFLSGSMILTFSHGSKSINNTCAGFPDIDINSDQAKDEVLGISQFPRIELVLIVSIVLGVLSSILLLVFYGKGVDVYRSLQGIVGVGSESSILRYSSNYRPPLINQAMLTFAYVSPMLGGIIMALRENKKHLALSLLSFLPSLLTFLTETTKAAILFSFILFISGYFASQVLVGRSNNYRLFSRNRLPIFLAIILISLIILSFGDIARKGQIPTISEMIKAARSSRASATVFGHAPAFSLWFQRAWAGNEELTFGAGTFGGVYDFFGIKEKVNVNPEAENFYISGDKVTNIISIFGVLASDFSLAGSLLFLFIFGLVASISYFKVGKGSLMLMPLLIAVYAFMSMQLTSIFKYSTVIMAILVIQAYIISIRIFQRRAQPQDAS